RPAAEPLDLLGRVQQGPRRPTPADLDHGVPESPLIAVPDGFGRVQRGYSQPRGQPRDLRNRVEDVPAAVADVGAEAEVCDPRGAPAGISTPLPPAARAARARAPRPLRTRRRLLPLPLRRPGPLPRTRWCSHRGWAP